MRRWGTLWKREKDKNVRGGKSDGLFGEGKLERKKRQEKEERVSKDHKVFCFGIRSSRHYRIKTICNSFSDNQREEHFLKTSD